MDKLRALGLKVAYIQSLIILYAAYIVFIPFFLFKNLVSKKQRVGGWHHWSLSADTIEECSRQF